MNLAIALVCLGQFFAALSVIGDKLLVSDHKLQKPVVYAFYISILSAVVVILLPFGVISMAEPHLLLLSAGVAIAYIVSIVALYSSIKEASVAEVAPIIGGVSALATFGLSHVFFDTTLPHNFILGGLFLIVGMVTISHFHFPRKIIFYMILSGLGFALSSLLVKEVFNTTDFVNGFFWTRMANVVGALLLLCIPGTVHTIFHARHKVKGHTSLLVIGNKAIGAISFIFILYAIKLSDASLVNALSATQYVFLFLLAVIFAERFPAMFKNEMKRKEIAHKIVSTSIIVIGFFLLFI